MTNNTEYRADFKLGIKHAGSMQQIRYFMYFYDRVAQPVKHQRFSLTGN